MILFRFNLLLIELLPGLPLEPVTLSFELHLLVSEEFSGTFLHVAFDLLTSSLGLLFGLGSLHLSVSLEFLSFPFSLHLLISNGPSDILLDSANNLILVSFTS